MGLNNLATAMKEGNWYLVMAYRKPHWAEEMRIQGPHKTKELALEYWKAYYQDVNYLVSIQKFEPVEV